MKTIPLTRGYVALVDDEDYDRLAKYKWRVLRCCTSTYTRFYAITSGPVVEDKQTVLMMHRLVLVSSVDVDHADTDGLNNQKYNLRTTTRTLNLANSRKRGGTTSTYKGVTWQQHVKKWRARVQKNGVAYDLGLFSEEVDAATAYNFKATDLFGPFARLNVPISIEV